MVSLIVEDYLLTDDDSVDELLRASEKGSTLNITLVGQGHLDKSAAADGLLRLDPDQNGDFTQNWLELWTCMVNTPQTKGRPGRSSWQLYPQHHTSAAPQTPTTTKVDHEDWPH